MSEHYTAGHLSDELRFMVALVSKIAILNPPDTLRLRSTAPNGNLGEVVAWWQPSGDTWFQDICAHVRGYVLSYLH